jgi:hypothetical protein
MEERLRYQIVAVGVAIVASCCVSTLILSAIY